jgi:spermidine/putrescine transport system permease protein
MNGTTRNSRAAGLVTALVFLFLFVPLAVVVLFSFQGSSSLTLPLTNLGFSWYRTVLNDPQVRAAFAHSALVGGGVALANLVVGTAAAYGVTRSRLAASRMAGRLLTAAVALPGLFIGVMLLSLFSAAHLGDSLFTVACAHFVWTFPLFFLLARVALDRVDRDLEDIAADLGARRWLTFRRVIWPQVSTLIISAAALSFAMSFDEFIATSFVVGPQQTVPTLIYGRLRIIIDPSINVISTLLMALLVGVTLAVALGVGAVQKRNKRLDPIIDTLA